jgi:hypothetical protein
MLQNAARGRKSKQISFNGGNNAYEMPKKKLINKKSRRGQYDSLDDPMG